MYFPKEPFTGLQFLAEVEKQDSPPPLILISSQNIPQADRPSWLRGFLQKPFNQEELTKILPPEAGQKNPDPEI